jgi:hypothetical protein
MASHALALYQAASSPYNLDGDLSFTRDDLVRAEILTLEATPLASLPPPTSHGHSESSSLKSTARTRPPLAGTKVKAVPPRRPTTSAIGVKRPASNINGPSKHLASTPSSTMTSSFHTTRASLSHILVGVDMPNWGRGKGFVQKVAPKTSAGSTSSTPLRIPRKNPRKAPDVVDSGLLPTPSIPTVTFLMSRVDTLTSMV